MEILLLAKAFLLGIIEGLTEFLPISSTGHLIIVGDLINFNDDKGKVFEIVIQLAAILAVCWEYRSRLGKVIKELPSSSTAQKFTLNLIIAFMPAAVLGLLFHKKIKTLLFNPTTVALALILGGAVIIWLEKRKQTIKVTTIDDITWQDSLKIGFCQALAMIPGTSRSGATIIGAIFFGFQRQTATEFSFFLAIPTIFAATCYDLLKNWRLFSTSDLPMFVVGFITSFVVALLVIRWLIRFVSHNSFNSFAWYRIILGFVVLAYFYH